MSESDFEIFEYRGKWIIKRTNGTEGQHGHLSNKSMCYSVRNWILKGIVPKKKYFIETVKRLLTTEELKHMKVKQKQSYFNHNPKHYGRRTA